jgi:hypothetical protein
MEKFIGSQKFKMAAVREEALLIRMEERIRIEIQ